MNDTSKKPVLKVELLCYGNTRVYGVQIENHDGIDDYACDDLFRMQQELSVLIGDSKPKITAMQIIGQYLNEKRLSPDDFEFI
jgi:hypothetical protein